MNNKNNSSNISNKLFELIENTMIIIIDQVHSCDYLKNFIISRPRINHKHIICK